MVMNLPGGDLSDHDLVRRKEVAGLGMLARRAGGRRTSPSPCRRRRRSVSGDVAEHDREPSVRERHVVVEIAADVDARRRTYTPPTSRPSTAGRIAAGASAASRPRSPFAAGRGGRCRPRAPPGRRSRPLSRSSPRRSGGRGRAESSVSEPSTSAGVAIGTIAAVEPFSRNGTRSERGTELVRRRDVELDRVACGRDAGRAGPRAPAAGRAPAHGASRRSSATCSASGSDCSRRGPACAAPRRRPRGARRPSGRPPRASRRARGLRERARDLVERRRAGAPRPARTRVPARSSASETGGLLVQPRVLNATASREAIAESSSTRRTRLPAPRRIDGEQTDHLVPTASGSAVALDSRFRERSSTLRERGSLDVSPITTTPRARYGPSASSSRASAATAGAGRRALAAVVRAASSCR